MQKLDPNLHYRIEQIVGQRLLHVRNIQRGYTPALRLVVSLADGTSVFAKVATNELTAGWLRTENRIYETLSGSFLAHHLGWDDDGISPALVLEDLSQAYWPPPWTNLQIQQVIETLELVSGLQIPGLPLLNDRSAFTHGWTRVAEQPEYFLSLGLTTEKWLETALPILLQINGREVISGQSLLHSDIHSGNICFVDGRTILIDWNWACIGNASFDLGLWLPSLEAERGPPPETILPNAGEIAALISGFFAFMAGQPPPKNMPQLRQIQLIQLRSALPWMVRELNLPSLDGASV